MSSATYPKLVCMDTFVYIAGYRRMRLPSLRPLGEERRGPEQGGPVREHAQDRAEKSLREQPESIAT